MARKRKNGDGTIRQRADGRWEGRYVIGYDDKGYTLPGAAVKEPLLFIGRATMFTVSVLLWTEL